MKKMPNNKKVNKKTWISKPMHLAKFTIQKNNKKSTKMINKKSRKIVILLNNTNQKLNVHTAKSQLQEL